MSNDYTLIVPDRRQLEKGAPAFLNVVLPFLFLLWPLATISVSAQTGSTSDYLKAQPIEDRTLFFDVMEMGVTKSVNFGADLAWANEQNFRRNIRFMGLDQVDLVRASFQPTFPLVNGELTQQQLDDLNWRLYLINTYVGPNTDLALNCDHPSVDNWYVGNPERWEDLIEVSTQKYLDAGHNVITVGAFNEPDYGWGQGSAQDMYNITALLNGNPLFAGVRLSGGNTLNCDEALGWYEYLVPAGVTEGNTHQLAGSFGGFASFFETVRQNGHHATDDELHNIVEALVGYEYGMQTGIWWADIDYASGEMVKAFDGERLAYAEHRANWTAAAVYRSSDGKIQAFGGTSERQAATTTYNFISKNRPVYFDGQGPQREFVLEMPGGTGYQNGQTNAERVVNITWGDDIQPEINGRYKLVNRSNGMVMRVAGNTNENGTNVQQGSYSGGNTEQWDVYPVDSRIGGDFSYYHIIPVSNSDMTLDLYGFNMDDGANISQWTNNNGGNQQWYLEYQGEGWFYIRSRESSYGAAFDDTGNLVQQELNGGLSQQWRLIPIDAQIEFNAPATPLGLVVSNLSNSIKLEWAANSESDLSGYHILRAVSSNGDYNTIARNVVGNSFVDNTALNGTSYFYKIQAEDKALNRSNFSSEVSATPKFFNGIVANYTFDENGLDKTENLNHSSVFGEISFGDGINGSKSIVLDGSENYLQLPTNIASSKDITIASWVYRNGGEALSRIFEFSNAAGDNLYLTAENASSQLYFGINNNGIEQGLGTSEIPTGEWVHVAVTMNDTEVSLYVNGKLANKSEEITLRPEDINPIMNYLGRSRNTTRMLNAELGDFRIYNYALNPQEIEVLAKSGFNFEITAKGETCPGQNNGEISIETNLGIEFVIHVNNQTYSFTNNFFSLESLTPGMYDICISSMEYDYEQCFSVEINESNSLSGKISSIGDKAYVEVNSGTAPYHVSVNGIFRFKTDDNNFDVLVNIGDIIEVKSASDCEGILTEKSKLFDSAVAYPNPSYGLFEVLIPTASNNVELEIYNVAGSLISSNSYQIQGGRVLVNLENQPSGIYLVKVNSEAKETIRVIKN